MLSFQKFVLLTLVLSIVVHAKAVLPTSGVRPTNILGGLEQHASFSFVRPGLTQTAFAFNGPASRQAFSSSVGDPQLAHKVLPNVAHALSYRNPGLGYTPIGPVAMAYVAGVPALPPPTFYQPQQLDYQQQQALALAYQQQLQQYQQHSAYAEYAQQVQAQSADAATQESAHHQIHLARLLASRFAAPQAQTIGTEAVPEQIQLQQQAEQQRAANLLEISYSSAPSVAHVKVNGNGFNFDF